MEATRTVVAWKEYLRIIPHCGDFQADLPCRRSHRCVEWWVTMCLPVTGLCAEYSAGISSQDTEGHLGKAGEISSALRGYRNATMTVLKGIKKQNHDFRKSNRKDGRTGGHIQCFQNGSGLLSAETNDQLMGCSLSHPDPDRSQRYQIRILTPISNFNNASIIL